MLQFNEHPKQDKFFTVFDYMCRRQLYDTVVHCRDTNQPIIDMDCFDAFIEGCDGQPAMVEQFMPRLWEHMCNLRNVYGNRSKADKKNVLPRKREVFVQILLLRRMRNKSKLKWWAMVQAIAFYSWGVGRTALNASNFFGITVHSTTRDRCLQKLCEDLVERRTKYLSSFLRVIVVLDNFRRAEDLKDMRGGLVGDTRDGASS